MPTITRADLESLLRTRKLDHTLAAQHLDPEPFEQDVVRTMVPTGIADLDARLRGGIPRGHLSELVGARSSGRLTLAVSALAGATARGEAVALVDPLDVFDPVSAAASGIDFSRMLWVRGEATSSARISLTCEYGTLQKSLDRAVKSLNLILQAGGFGLVVLDLADVGSQVLARLPFTTWLRLHRVVEGSDTAVVLLGSQPIARSAGGVTIQLTSGFAPRQARGVLSKSKDGLQASGQSPNATINARVIQTRVMETRDVCVPVSAAAC